MNKIIKQKLDSIIIRLIEAKVQGTPEQIQEKINNVQEDWGVKYYSKFEKLINDKGDVRAQIEATKRLAKHLKLI